MSDIQIPAGQYATAVLAGNGSTGAGPSGPTPLQAGSTVVSLSAADYAKVYVADAGPGPGGVGRVLAFVPKVQAGAGGSYDVTVNCSGNDAVSGQALAPLSIDVQVVGPPLVVQATHFELAPGSITFAPLSSAPPDPGSSSITF